MKRFFFFSLFIFLIYNTVGCVSYNIKNYETPDTNKKILVAYSSNGYSIKLGNFTSNLKDNSFLKCRAISINLPENRPVQDYFKNALKNELLNGRIYSDNGEMTIGAHINSIKATNPAFSGDATWEFDVDFVINDKIRINIKHLYSYYTTFDGQEACSRSAKYFVAAAQEIIEKLFDDKLFKEQFKKYYSKNKDEKPSKSSTLAIDNGVYVRKINGKIVNNKNSRIINLEPGIYRLGEVFYSKGNTFTHETDFNIKIDENKILLLTYKKTDGKIFFYTKEVKEIPR